MHCEVLDQFPIDRHWLSLVDHDIGGGEGELYQFLLLQRRRPELDLIMLLLTVLQGKKNERQINFIKK